MAGKWFGVAVAEVVELHIAIFYSVLEDVETGIVSVDHLAVSSLSIRRYWPQARFLFLLGGTK